MLFTLLYVIRIYGGDKGATSNGVSRGGYFCA